MTLNALYYTLASFQGTRLLSHELNLSVDRTASNATSSDNPLTRALVAGAAKNVDDTILQEVANRLVADPIVNSKWIPDAIEKQIYFACLQVMFRVLHVALSSFKIKLCGHVLTIQFVADPTTDGESNTSTSWEQAALAITKTSTNTTTTDTEKSSDESSTSPILNRHRVVGATPVDLNLLRTSARKAGVDEETNTDRWWNRIFTRSDFVQQLHISLYGLILGILDYVLVGQVEIQILSDSIQLDLVPPKSSPYNNSSSSSYASDEATTYGTEYDLNGDKEHDSTGVSVESFAAASFAAGLGMGISLMAILANSQQP